MEYSNSPFIPGEGQPQVLPLGRYLPPLPFGMVGTWLRGHVPPGELVIDPVGSTPILPIEAAQAGYRILICSNNPIISFMLETLAAAPQKGDFQAALAELSSTRKGDERLEIHLQSLYLTECSSCGQTNYAQAFLWHRDETYPYARLYNCKHCGDQGERPITSADLERLKLLGSDSLHRSRAIERVRLGEGVIRTGADEAIHAYLPRPLYFLFTVLNKIEGLSLTKSRRNLLIALALSACDEGSALWSWPSTRNRPRQLVIPPQYRENNLWNALENAIKSWVFLDSPLPITHWPDLPPKEGGICLYPGRIKAISSLPTGFNPSAALVAIPRPNQVFWTLCAVWSGWIWGQEALVPLRKVLERRRYDWHWLCEGLFTTLTNLHRLTGNDFHLFGMLGELAPGFLSASLLASEAAGFRLTSFSQLSEEEFAQAEWVSHQRIHKGNPGQQQILSLFQQSIRQELVQQNQPISYPGLHSAAWISLSRQDFLPANQSQVDLKLLSTLQSDFEQLLETSLFLEHYKTQSQSIESGYWWLAENPESGEMPLSDRVELETVRYLQKHQECNLWDVRNAIYSIFPGLLTPPTTLVQVCLESYGDMVSKTREKWQLRHSETPTARRKDILEMNQILCKLGAQFQFFINQGEPLEWVDLNKKPVFRFYIFASSIISRFVLKTLLKESCHLVLVLPGSRSNLLSFKLREDPRLAAIVQNDWHFLKFRHLRKLGQQNGLTAETFFESLSQDLPAMEEPRQMTFF